MSPSFLSFLSSRSFLSFLSDLKCPRFPSKRYTHSLHCPAAPGGATGREERLQLSLLLLLVEVGAGLGCCCLEEGKVMIGA